MALLKTIKDYIKTVFYTNGNEEITGQTSQDGLIGLIDAVGAAQNGGTITASFNPGTQTDKGHKFYFASTAGYYIHFGHTVLTNQFVQFTYNHTTNAWDKTIIGTFGDGVSGIETWDIHVGGTTVQIHGTGVDEIYNAVKLKAGDYVEISAASGVDKGLQVTFTNTAPFIRTHKKSAFIESDCLIAEPYSAAPNMRLAEVGSGSYEIGTPTKDHPGVISFKDGNDFLSGAALHTHNSFILAPIGGEGSEIYKATWIAKFPIAHTARYAFMGFFNEPGVTLPNDGIYVYADYSATYGVIFRLTCRAGGLAKGTGFAGVNHSPSTWYRVELIIETDTINDEKIAATCNVYNAADQVVSTVGLPTLDPIAASLMFGCYTLDSNNVVHGSCMDLDYISLEGMIELNR